MCRLGECGPPWPNEQAAFIRFVADVSQPGFEGDLELRFMSSTDATVGNTGSACAGWSASSWRNLEVPNGGRAEVPRASPNCNVWGASSQWAIYEPESHSGVADKYYGDLYVVQNEDRIITQVTYNPRDTLFCLGSFTWVMDEVGLVTVNPAENRRSYSSVVRRWLSIPRPLGCPLSLSARCWLAHC
jgi:hypothetical protein